MTDTRKRLTKAGLPEEAPLRGAADAGYPGDDDKAYLLEVRGKIVVPPPAEGTTKNGDLEMFKRDDCKRSGGAVSTSGAANGHSRTIDQGPRWDRLAK